MLTRANTGTLSTLQRVKEGVDYVHSEHSKERMSERNISQTQLEKTLDNPDKINPGNKSGTSEYLSQLPSGMILKAVVSNDNPKTVITVIKMRKHKDFK